MAKVDNSSPIQSQKLTAKQEPLKPSTGKTYTKIPDIPPDDYNGSKKKHTVRNIAIITAACVAVLAITVAILHKKEKLPDGMSKFIDQSGTNIKNFFGKIFSKSEEIANVTEHNAQVPINSAQKQIKPSYLEKMERTEAFYNAHKTELNSSVLRDEIYAIDPNTGSTTKVKRSELFHAYKGKLDTLYHGTTSGDNYNSILENGFDIYREPVHGYKDVTTGTCFALKPPGSEYGNFVVRAKFRGRVAEANTDLISGIKRSMRNSMAVEKIMKTHGITDIEAEEVLNCMIRDMFMKEGYTGIIGNNWSAKAQSRYFIALDPQKIKILK